MKKYFFLIAIFAFIYFIVLKYNNADWDLWARLAVGAIFFQTGAVLKQDIFAYTPTKAIWVDHEWGSGVVFYYLSHFFGDYGLLCLKFFIILMIFLFVFENNQLRRIRRETPYRLSYYLLLLYGLLPGFANTIRSQSFTYLFFAIWLYLLELVKRGKDKIIWLFPLTMILWANLHGGFLAGLGIVAIYGIGEMLNKRPFIKYFGIFTLSALASLINPYGLKYWTYILQAISLDRPYVAEWQPLNLFEALFQVLGFKIILALSLIAFIYLLIKKFKQINWAEIFILAITLYMSLKHIRHVIFFVIAASSYMYYYFYPAVKFFTLNIAGKFYSLFPIKFKKFTILTKDIIVYSLIMSISFLAIYVFPLKIKVNQNQFPVRAVEFIKINNLKGNLLVLFNWGSYALWKLYPNNLIAVDGRYEEVYDEDFIGEIARFHYVGKNWSDLLTKYRSDVLLIPTEYPVYNKILFMDNWKLVYKDDMAAVFVPKAKYNKKWINLPKKSNFEKTKFETNIKIDS